MRNRLRQILAKHAEKHGSLISLLQDTQDVFGYLPQEAIGMYSEELDIPASRFFGIATFYAQFHLKPRGRNIITACCGTACHVRGAERIISTIRRELNLDEVADTTDDGQFTLEQHTCIGACSMAPVVILNGSPKGRANSEMITREIRAMKKNIGNANE